MREYEMDHLYDRPDVIIPFRMIIAPIYRQAKLFINEMKFYEPECKVAREPMHLRGYRLDTWEVWWLDRMWPCRTHEDVNRMLEMKRLAKMYGADIRHWWT